MDRRRGRMGGRRPGDGVWVGGVWIGGVGVWEDGDLGVSGPLAVVSEDGSVDQGAGASLEADGSVTLLLVDSQGGDEAGNLVNWSLEVTIVSGLGLVTSDSYGDTVASDHSCGVVDIGVGSVQELWGG